MIPIGTYETPVYITSDPDDPRRLFVVEQGGRILLVTDSDTSTFLDLTDVVRVGQEQGLLSVAFPPDFAGSDLFYVVYTGRDGGALHLDELRASGGTVDPSSRRPLMTIDHSQHPTHYGGQLQFGPDGLLYLSTGDGGGQGDPLESGQDLTSLLGKLLRIDPKPEDGAPYSIPPDNPFADSDHDPPGGARDEIWAYGFRNPWKFSFDRLTGALLIGDVGQGGWEELDYAPQSWGGGRGANFGWDCREGMHDHELTGCPLGPFTDPAFEYGHTGGNCSITGGYVVRDPSLADLYGRYVYADYCVGQLRSLVPGLPLATDDRPEGLPVPNASSFGEDACGRIYAVSLGSPAGTIFRLGDMAGDACTTKTATVDVAGDGAGRVTGVGIDCPGDCSEAAYVPKLIELQAIPTPGSRFVGWSGACSGTGLCPLSLTADTGATATFGRTIATTLSLSARSKRARRGKRVAIEAAVAECPDRVGDPVEVLRDDVVSRQLILGRRCIARAKILVRRTTSLSAEIAADGRHLAATARPVTITVQR